MGSKEIADMLPSSLPSSDREEPLPAGPQRQKKFVYEKLAVLATLVILALGYLDVLPLSALWNLSQGRQTKETDERIDYTPEDLYVRHIQARPARDIDDFFAIVELFPFPDQPTPTPFFLVEPATPLARRIVDIPPPPYSFPTPTPTRTPTPSPTATSTPLPPQPTSTPQPAAILMPTLEPESGINHVILISIDGLRPDALAAAEAPTLDRLILKGTYCPNAQTVKFSITLPGHASMLSGMIPEKHGIVWNAPYIGWPGMSGPTLFNVAHDAGFSTAMVFGKQKMNYMVLGDSVDKLFGEDVHDPEIRDKAIEFIQEGLTDILFIHFPDTDRVGHAYGWMSPNQFQSIAFVDGLIGEIIAVLEQENYLNNTLIIVTADHGGHGFGHGDDSPLDKTIPWLAVGPGVPAGVTLAGGIDTYDTAATVLYALDLPIPEKWDGRPVMEIFAKKEGL
jgi:hypothetical protein